MAPVSTRRAIPRSTFVNIVLGAILIGYVFFADSVRGTEERHRCRSDVRGTAGTAGTAGTVSPHRVAAPGWANLTPCTVAP